MPNSMSEDELFKALLKKKPEVQVPVRKETQRPAPAAQPAESNEEKEHIIETPPVKPLETDLALESIKNLTASVNMMYRLIKTVIVPVLVLILVVGIAILVRTG